MILSRFFLIAAIGAMIAMLPACSGSTAEGVEHDLQQAEMAVAQGDMRAARSVADHLTHGRDYVDLSPRQLARLSLVYMQIADNGDAGSNVSMAADCYRKAFEADRDSAAAFYSNVKPEHIPYAVMLTSIVKSLDNPYTDFEDDDSIHGIRVRDLEPDSISH